VRRQLLEEFRTFGEIASWGADIGEFLFMDHKSRMKLFSSEKKRIQRMSAYERRELETDLQKELDRLKNLHKADIQSDIEGKIDKELEEKLRGALRKPEMVFFFKVWIPCWFLYGDYPAGCLDVQGW